MEGHLILSNSKVTNINVDIFWTNSPTKEQEFLKIAVEEKCSIDTIRKKVLKLLMDTDKIQYDEQEIEKEDFNLDSMIEIMTNRGHFLSEKDEYLTIGDFKVGQNQELCVIVQTKTFGLIHVALHSSSDSSFSLLLALNLRLDTFATLKSRLREFAKKSPENSFKFIYDGESIDLEKEEGDDRPILKCLKKNTNIWYYQPSGSFSVNILKVTGEIITIGQDIQPESTLEKLKRLIDQRTGMPPDQQRIIFDGRQLEDGRTLKDYDVEDGSILLMGLRLRGGGGGPTPVGAVSIPGISFADLSDSRNLVQRAFSTEAPDWRVVTEGLNIEGICGNTNCEAYNQQVIASRGFKDFHLKYDSGRIKCPICWKKLKELRTCGFASTFWRYFGRKGINESELLNSDWAEAGDDAYTTFDVNKPGGGLKGMESWSLLVIQARPIFEGKSGKYPEPSHCGFCFQPTEHTQLERLSCGHIYHKNCTKKSHFRCNLCVFNIH